MIGNLVRLLCKCVLFTKHRIFACIVTFNVSHTSFLYSRHLSLRAFRPATCYIEPEFATVGDLSGGKDVDVYSASLEHNDRAILDGDKEGYVKIFCKKGTGTIIGCCIIAGRAGELINEVTLAMKHGISLDGIGRNIHCYPTTGESVMGCGLQIINSKWKLLK